MECWWPKSVTQGSVWSDQFCSIFVNYILEQTKCTQSKDKWLPRNGSGLFIDRSGKSFEYIIPTKGPKQVSIIFEREVGHPGGVPSVTNKRRRRGGVFRGIPGWYVPQLGSKVAVYDITIQ